jgi:hydrogenase nickel incorporation protein HypA/HybF
MHELAITQGIVEVVSERCSGRKVSRVVLEIGKLSLVMPDAIRFCFELCCEGTELEGASLEIIEMPGLGRCTDCQANVVLNEPLGQCGCGSMSLEWIRGEELTIKEVEMHRNV